MAESNASKRKSPSGDDTECLHPTPPPPIADLKAANFGVLKTDRAISSVSSVLEAHNKAIRASNEVKAACRGILGSYLLAQHTEDEDEKSAMLAEAKALYEIAAAAQTAHANAAAVTDQNVPILLDLILNSSRS